LHLINDIANVYDINPLTDIIFLLILLFFTIFQLLILILLADITAYYCCL